MAYTTRSAAQAVAKANSISRWETAMCLNFVFNCLTDVSAGLPDANAAWAAAKQIGTGTPPAGAPVYFAGYTHGHIAISLGGGRIRSTDVPYATAKGTFAPVGNINIGDIERDWGIKYRGWSRDYAGQIIRGLEATSTQGSGTPPLPATPPPAPAPQEDDVLSSEAQTWIEGRLDAHDAYVIASLRNSTTVEGFWTGYNIVKDPSATNPDTAPRVTPSTLLERATWDTKVQRASGPVAALQELADTKTMVAALAQAVKDLTAKVDALPKG